jgi:flagellin
MSAVLNTNTASLWAAKNLLGAQNRLAASVERLSSGLRINRARDDAAGLGVANSLTAQINGANQGIRNLNDAISMVQTAEGAISAASDMGQRILMLATQGANGTLGADERAAIKAEMLQLLSSIDSIGGRTKFSGNPLMNYATNNIAGASSAFYSMQISNTSSDKVSLSSDAFLSIGSTGRDTSDSSARLVLSSTTANSNVADLGAGTGTAAPTVAKLQDGGGGFTEQSKVTFTALTAGQTAILNGLTYTAVGAVSASEVAAAFASKIAGGTPAGFTGAWTAGWALSAEYSAADGMNSGRGHATALLAAVNDVDPTAVAATATAKFQAVQTAANNYVISLGEQRSLLGAYQNQMEYTLANITELSSNLSSARSRVIDTDYASETAALTRGQILQQAATAMLAQANQMPNVILTLLK